MESPETSERQAASSSAGAESLRPLPLDVVCEGLLEIQPGGRGWDGAEGGFQEGWGASRWLPSQFPLPRGRLVPGVPMPGAVHQAERREAGPSWQTETECPPGPQWKD